MSGSVAARSRLRCSSPSRTVLQVHRLQRPSYGSFTFNFDTIQLAGQMFETGLILKRDRSRPAPPERRGSKDRHVSRLDGPLRSARSRPSSTNEQVGRTMGGPEEVRDFFRSSSCRTCTTAAAAGPERLRRFLRLGRLVEQGKAPQRIIALGGLSGRTHPPSLPVTRSSRLQGQGQHRRRSKLRLRAPKQATTTEGSGRRRVRIRVVARLGSRR